MQSTALRKQPPADRPAPFDILSTELVKAVLSFADAKTVGRCGCASKQLAHTCSAVLRSPVYIRTLQPVLATHVIVFQGGEAALAEPVDEPANPGQYTVRTDSILAGKISAPAPEL